MRGLLPIESTYLACLVNTYAVRGRTAAQPRSLEGTLPKGSRKETVEKRCIRSYGPPLNATF